MSRARPRCQVQNLDQRKRYHFSRRVVSGNGRSTYKSRPHCIMIYLLWPFFLPTCIGAMHFVIAHFGARRTHATPIQTKPMNKPPHPSVFNASKRQRMSETSIFGLSAFSCDSGSPSATDYSPSFPAPCSPYFSGHGRSGHWEQKKRDDHCRWCCRQRDARLPRDEPWDPPSSINLLVVPVDRWPARRRADTIRSLGATRRLLPPRLFLPGPRQHWQRQDGRSARCPGPRLGPVGLGPQLLLPGLRRI